MANAKDTNYDKVADIYLASNEEVPFTRYTGLTNYYERPFILGSLPSLSQKTILDLGCASGFYSKFCQDNGASVISVDASEKMVKHTEKLCEYKNKGYIHDIAKPFDFIEDNSIDLIICSLVLHYVDNWSLTLKEMYRMLKSKGTCIISTLHPVMDFMRFNQNNYFSKRMVEDVWHGLKEPIKVNFFVRSLSDYLQPVLASGLSLKEIVEPKPLESLKTKDPNLYKLLMTKPIFLFFILEKNP